MAKQINYDDLGAFYDETRDQVDEIAMFLDQKEALAQAADAETRARIEAGLTAKKGRIAKLIPEVELRLAKVESLKSADGGTIKSISETVQKAKAALDLAA